MPKISPLTVALLAGFAAGCRTDDFLTSIRLRPQTQFVLRTVHGEKLPTVAYEGAGITSRFVADTITLRNDGTGTEHGHLLSQKVGEPGETSVTLNTPLIYSLVGTKIYVDFPCQEVCVAILRPPAFAGEVMPWGIRFDMSSSYRVPMVYDKRR